MHVTNPDFSSAVLEGCSKHGGTTPFFLPFELLESFGNSTVFGPSGRLPWLLGGSEDPWLSVFRRVWLVVVVA